VELQPERDALRDRGRGLDGAKGGDELVMDLAVETPELGWGWDIERWSRGLFLITVIYHCISKFPFRVLLDADIWKYTSIVIIIGFLEIIDAFRNLVDGETSVLTNGLVLQFIVAPVLRFCRRDVELLQN
jgi:hypothetical protein